MGEIHGQNGGFSLVFTIKLEGYALFSHKTLIFVPDSEGFCEKPPKFGITVLVVPLRLRNREFVPKTYLELAVSNEERYKYNPSWLFLMVWLVRPAVITTLYNFQRIGDGKYFFYKMGVAHWQMGSLKLFVGCVFNPHNKLTKFLLEKRTII